jgi:FemAB-related protein (PEP-CTERM system-associated)
MIELGHLPAAQAAIAVRVAKDNDKGRWDRFVMNCPNATFFHRFGWKSVIERSYGHRTIYLLAERGGEIEAVLPLVQVKSLLFGHGLVSLPFGVYGGPASLSSAGAEALVTAAVEWTKELGAHHLELRNRQALCPTWPRQDLYVSFRREIFADEEANLLAIPRKQRAMVRKGIKAGLRSEIDGNIDRFFSLYADNVHRHGTPAFPKRYFEALLAEFGADVEPLIVVSDSGAIMSGVLSFYFRDEVLPYYAGDHILARENAANDFKYWELMRRSCERGYKVFDYGRSKQGTGSFDFKKNWGFEPESLAYEYWLPAGGVIPQNNPSNPKYKAFINLWRKLPISLANVVGPHISKYLG